MATGKFFGLFFTSVMNKEIDLNSDVIKAMLCTNLYTPNQDTHQYKSSVTNEVAAGANYVAGGFTLGTVTFAYDTATNTWSFDAPDVTMSPVAPLSRYLVLYDSTPATDATRPLIGYVDFITDQTPALVQWDGGGIGAVVVA
jgi:hypothetical protein